MKNSKFFDVINYVLVIIFSIICTLPMLLVVMVSITDESIIQRYGYSLIPKKFSIEAYIKIFNNSTSIVNSYMITIFITVVGTTLAVIITGMAGYTLANKQVKYRNALALYFFITMIFNGGMVPWYIMCTKLGLRNNILALIIPNLVFNPFNLFLVRNFMSSIPDSLMESAKIDGAGDAYIAFKIYFPLCKPVLATITLFYALGYWNDWWNAVMLIDNKRLYPLQYLLFKLKSDVQMIRELGVQSAAADVVLPSEALKMATAVVTIGPIIFLYPYLQRYFVKGLIIGSVKG